MKSKKAQEGIIVTVLLVLVAIAAVGAVAYFVINTVRTGTATATDKSECLKITIGIDKVTTATSGNVKLSRQSEEIVLSGLNVYVNGKYNQTNTTIPKKLETTTISVRDLVVGDIVRINPVLNSTGFVCESQTQLTTV